MAKKDTRGVVVDPNAPVTVAFANQGDFTAWHDAKCLELGIPAPGFIEGQEGPAVEHQWTQAYVEPRVIDGYWTVTLPPEEIAADATLKALEVLTVKYPASPGSDVDEAGQPISAIEVAPIETYGQPKPAQWTDPATGITYDSETGEVVP